MYYIVYSNPKTSLEKKSFVSLSYSFDSHLLIVMISQNDTTFIK